MPQKQEANDGTLTETVSFDYQYVLESIEFCLKFSYVFNKKNCYAGRTTQIHKIHIKDRLEYVVLSTLGFKFSTISQTTVFEIAKKTIPRLVFIGLDQSKNFSQYLLIPCPTSITDSRVQIYDSKNRHLEFQNQDQRS